MRGELQDTDIMPFGKYHEKKTMMQDVPASYLHWLWTNGKSNQVRTCPVAAYIHRNLRHLKEEYPDGIWGE